MWIAVDAVLEDEVGAVEHVGAGAAAARAASVTAASVTAASFVAGYHEAVLVRAARFHTA